MFKKFLQILYPQLISTFRHEVSNNFNYDKYNYLPLPYISIVRSIKGLHKTLGNNGIIPILRKTRFYKNKVDKSGTNV